MICIYPWWWNWNRYTIQVTLFHLVTGCPGNSWTGWLELSSATCWPSNSLGWFGNWLGLNCTIGGSVTSTPFCFCDWRRMKYQIKAIIMANPATPPTTPPAIGPAVFEPDEELPDPSDSGSDVAVAVAVVDVTPPVLSATPGFCHQHRSHSKG